MLLAAFDPRIPRIGPRQKKRLVEQDVSVLYGQINYQN